MPESVQSNTKTTPDPETIDPVVAACAVAETVPATDPRVLEAVRSVWGYSSLRPMQSAAIAAAIAGRDCLTILPTGGGKSLCYQIPPLVTEKITLVVSPLIALMRDQVRGLELNGYPAAALHSGMDRDEARDITTALRAGDLRLVLAAPERMVTASFKSLIADLADRGMLGSIAIDEAHCISQWGHDFRPDYRRLLELRELVPNTPMQAFTATATPRVRSDIITQLRLGMVCPDRSGTPEVLVGTFDRPNLTYRVHARRDAAEQTAEAVTRHTIAGDSGGAIVYCLSRKDTEELAARLRGQGLNAEAYHAGLSEHDRRDVEGRFSAESLDVVVATVAFGMGIDRSNVRLVVHATMPKSIEAYQQETGRAGRDGEPAECLLLYSPADASRWEGLIRMGANDSGHSGDNNAVDAQIELIRGMSRLIAGMTCRHRALSEHFGQQYTPPPGAATCGACDVCLGETLPEPDATRVSQIIMSAVARTQQRYGAAHIADVVRGAASQGITNAGHEGLSVYGMLRTYRKPLLVSYIDQLVAADALVRVIDGRFQTLRFGPRGVAVMKGTETVALARPMGTATATEDRRKRRPVAIDASPLSPDQKARFERLRTLRKSIADDRGVPPYVVFSDATLRELVRAMPGSLDAMLAVKGIGRAKLREFGDAFLRELRAE